MIVLNRRFHCKIVGMFFFYIAKGTLLSNLQPGMFKYTRSCCNNCNFINPAKSLSGPNSTVAIPGHFTRTSCNAVYCISCSLCNKLYILKTARRLQNCFREHLVDVRTHDNDIGNPVSRHFNLTGLCSSHVSLWFGTIPWKQRLAETHRRGNYL